MTTAAITSGCTVDGCEKTAYGRFCSMHRARLRDHGSLDDPRRPDVERFWEKVDVQPDGCWLWRSALNNKGYGQFHLNGRNVLTHRWSYEYHGGPIPDGMVLDHFACRTPACVNPAHLEPVTQAENMARARLKECRRGHPFTDESTYITAKGGRDCRVCRRTTQRERRRAAALSKGDGPHFAPSL